MSRRKELAGFPKPIRLSKELSIFMNKYESCRSEVTHAIIDYIKKNNLINSDRVIIPDAKLKVLLGIETPVRLIDLPRYISPHFIN